jgi:cytochrome c biogenesis protein CcmG/thiol:disulfide interchange protein DsbE
MPLLILASILLGGFWIIATADPESAASRPPSPHVGFAAPDFSLVTLEGEALRLSDLRGRVVILNFWATWCPPFRAEMPALERIAKAYEPAGLMVLGVHATDQDSVGAARAFAADFELTFPIVLDTEGAASRLYALRAMPSTYVIDKDGIIREVILGGPLSEATLESLVQSLLEDVP